MKLRPYQEDAINSTYEWMGENDGFPLIVLPTGCHAVGTGILMFDGSVKNVENVVVGDLLMGPDSKPRTVLQLARGRERMFEIQPKKGEPFVVNEGHILSLESTNEGKLHKYPSYRTGKEIENVSVKDWLAWSKTKKHLHKLRRVSVDFPEISDPIIPPWEMGILLGDGSFTQCVSVTTADEEIRERFVRYAASLGLKTKIERKKDNKAFAMLFPQSNWTRATENPIKARIRLLGLDKKDSSSKFIPECYKLGSREVRLGVIAGLIDSDGHYNVCGTFDFVTKSVRLAKDVVFVARSLGLAAYSKLCEKRCQTGGGGAYFRVYISGDLSIIPTVLPRKQATKRLQKKSVLKTSFTATPVGDGDFYGFSLSGDHLYLTSDFVVHHNTGKSVVIAEFCRRTLTAWPDTRILIVTHVRELIRQNFEELIRLWPEAPAGINSAGIGSRDVQSPIVFCGIQSVHNKPEHFGKVDLVLVDEAHMIPPLGAGMYRKFLDFLKLANPHMRCIGLTATPYRLGTGRLDEGDDRVFDGVSYEANVLDMIEQGYLAPVVGKATATRLSVSGVGTSGGDFVLSQLERAVDRDDANRAAVAEIMERGADRKSWLIFCSGVAHASHIAEIVREHGVSCETIFGDTPKTDRDRIVSSFKAGRIRCLASMAVLTTGFNAPAVDLIAMLRPTKSASLYCLDMETEILTSRGWMGPGLVRAGDRALAIDMNNGKGCWSGVVATIQRQMEEKESWVEYDAPRANFRVTENHRMIYQSSTYRGGWSPMKIDSAKNMASHKDSIRIPSAVSIETPGVPLTDDELYIIGILMTDGTWTSVQATIYQSEMHPEILSNIEKALAGAGIAYKKSRIKPPSQDSLIKEKHARWRYTISMGDPRMGASGKGLRYLMPFLDNDLAPALMLMSKSQFKTLLLSIYDGDGFKVNKCPNIDWTPRGWTICSARSVLLDRLQALSAMHGMTANLRWDSGRNRSNPIGVITVTEKDWRSVGGTGDRPKIRIEPATKENVWCVETEHGTIVTRRRGKVTVMGNCQIVGRGMRLAQGKENCLVLDFAGNIARHGPVDAVRPRKPRESEDGEAPAKECPECHTMLHASLRECPECGHIFPPPEPKVEARASDLPVLSTEKIPPEWVRVDDVDYNIHRKPGSPPSLRVSYGCGLRSFAEWVCLEHEGFAKSKARMWWQKRMTQPGVVPPTVEEAMKLVHTLAEPSEIKVRRNGKYVEVIDAKIVRGLPPAGTRAVVSPQSGPGFF